MDEYHIYGIIGGTHFPTILEDSMSPSMLPAEITQLRNDLGGNTLLAVVSGTRNRHDAERWMSGELVPTDNQLERFAVARQLFDRIAGQDDGATARAVFLGRNTIVNGKRTSLIMAIRDGRFDEARIAAQKYIACESV